MTVLQSEEGGPRVLEMKVPQAEELASVVCRVIQVGLRSEIMELGS